MRTLALLLAFALTACQFGTREIRLDALVEFTPPSPANGHSVVVRVADRRSDWLGSTVGHVKDGYDRPCAPIVADHDPRGWFEECLVARLRHAGFAARAGDEAMAAAPLQPSTAADPAELALDVELFDCETTAFWSYSAWLRIALTVTRDGSAVVPRTLLEARATGEANFGGFSSRYEAVLDDATADLLDQVVAVCRDVAAVPRVTSRAVAKLSQ